MEFLIDSDGEYVLKYNNSIWWLDEMFDGVWCKSPSPSGYVESLLERPKRSCRLYFALRGWDPKEIVKAGVRGRL